MRYQGDSNLNAELAVFAETLGIDSGRVRSAIYGKALVLRGQINLPLDPLTVALMKGVADNLAACALRGQRPSIDEVIEEAAQSICGSAKFPD